ncbi:Uncharacterised protein [Mycolicibacterium gilvum]|uniref:Uncharacterized protein n=1 Tax=Mycolicibacterium gilvum TaxID=1804 RepID=A0A378SJ82_9MYCO|nr:Uncharacterised protein [Mycolicibacterium gilvum]
MPSAFIATGLTRRGAGLQHRTGQIGIVAGVARKHPTRRLTQICTIEVGANAGGQLLDRLFTQTGICACGTCLCAFDTRLDARRQCRTVDAAEILRVGFQHFSRGAHLPHSITVVRCCAARFHQDAAIRVTAASLTAQPQLMDDRRIPHTSTVKLRRPSVGQGRAVDKYPARRIGLHRTPAAWIPGRDTPVSLHHTDAMNATLTRYRSAASSPGDGLQLGPTRR